MNLLRSALLFLVPAASILIFAGCAAPTEPSATSNDDLTGVTLSPLLADVLSGGEFRCRQQTSDIHHRGDLRITFAPARRPGAWISSTTLAGSVYNHAYSTNDGAFDIRVSGAALVGQRSVNHGDIGQGYYCGGAGSYTCGPERVDKVRIFMKDGAIRCQIQATMDEVWQDDFTYDIESSTTRLSTCFNEGYYLDHNPDVANAVTQGSFASGRAHYDQHGRNEGRAGCACEFDEAYYLASNPDVADAVKAGAFLTGRHHYALHGQADGRRACPDAAPTE